MGRQRNDDKVSFEYNMLITHVNTLNITDEEIEELIERIDKICELLMTGAKLK